MRSGLVFLLLTTTLNSGGQEKLGISNSNYSSTNAIFLNPSSSVDARTYMQLNVVGVNGFVSTNMAYLPNFRAWSLIKSPAPDPVLLNPKTKEYLSANAVGEGLSYVISTKEYGFGIFTRVRSVLTSKGIPYEAATQLSDPNSDLANSHPAEIKLKNAFISNMSWAEFGINFGKFIRKEPDVLIALSANLKYLSGININYKRIAEFDAVLIDTVYQISHLKGKDRYNDPGWATGRGLAADFGITYKKMLKSITGYFPHSPRSNCAYIDYKYKVGVSLMDVGAIRFKKNTYRLDVDTGSYTTYKNVSSTNDLAPFYTLNKPIWAVMPSAAVIQIDYNLENKVYINATVIKNLVPDAAVGVQGANLICLSPRFETKNVEVSLPFTLQKFRYPHLGVAFRVRSCVFGVDNVIPFIIKANTKQIGVYCSLGISLFKNQTCNTKKNVVDDCKPGLKKKRGLRKEKMGRNMSKQRKTKRKWFNWF